MRGGCHALPRLTEFSGVVLSCFKLSRWTIFYGKITHTTGRLAHTKARGNYSFKVMGQETCQYIIVLRLWYVEIPVKIFLPVNFCASIPLSCK